MFLRRFQFALCAACVLFASVSVQAQTGFVLPEAVPPPKNLPQKAPVEGEPLMIPMPSVRLDMGLVDLPDVRGIPLERPQSLTVLRHRHADEVAPPQTEPATAPETSGQPKQPEENTPQDTADKPTPALAAPVPARSEHLSTLEETTLYDAPGWTTEVALPHPGVYQFILETKPTWTPDRNRFLQHTSKSLYAGQDDTSLWDRPAGIDFEILPKTRPFGICAGMSFTGQVLQHAAPLADTTVDIIWLPPDNPAQRKKSGKPPFTPVQHVRTDAEGRFTATLPWAGWWGFSAVTPGGDPLRDPDGQMRPVDQTTSLWIPLVTCTPGTPR